MFESVFIERVGDIDFPSFATGRVEKNLEFFLRKLSQNILTNFKMHRNCKKYISLYAIFEYNQANFHIMLLYVEKNILTSPITKQILGNFPHAQMLEIDHYKNIFDFPLAGKTQKSYIIAAVRNAILPAPD